MTLTLVISKQIFGMRKIFTADREIFPPLKLNFFTHTMGTESECKSNQSIENAGVAFVNGANGKKKSSLRKNKQ